MSPSTGGASSSSPGPVKVEWVISPPNSFFTLNLTAPFKETEGDMAIMAPGLAVIGQPMASCRVSIELVSLWDTRNAPPLKVPTSSADPAVD